MPVVTMQTRISVNPQPGPQTDFLKSRADIAFYGGAAGGGKSYGLLLDVLRHYSNPLFKAVIFRRTSTQIKNPGGLWHDSLELYTMVGASPREYLLEWNFPKGMLLKFAHLEYEKNIYDWQGAQIPFIGFDEVTHFSERMFFYMLSRNRSTSGVPGYVRATCNPDADSWVRHFLDWWIDDDGYPNKKRIGKLRWFIRLNDTVIWRDTKKEILDEFGHEIPPKSVTFIPSKLQDNKILMQKDPSYRANLLALPRVDRLRLEGGNWNVRITAGSLFKREWFRVIDAIPSGWVASIRFWDRAATKPSEENKDPDWTRGLKLYQYPNGTFVIADLKSLRDTPGQVESLVKNTASHDGLNTIIMSQQDPGSAGVAEAENFIRMLKGFIVKTMTTSKDKVNRAKPVSAQVEAGNIMVVRAPWNNEFFDELENFPEGAHDDIVDVLSGAFNALCGDGASIFDVL